MFYLCRKKFSGEIAGGIANRGAQNFGLRCEMPETIKEIVCDATIEAVNNAIADQHIEPARIIAIVRDEGFVRLPGERAYTLPRYHVIFREAA